MKVQERKRTEKSRPPAARAPVPVAARPHSRAGLLRAAGLFFLSLIAYANSFSAGFVLDNRGIILKNPVIRDASATNIGLIFNHTYWWPNGESGLYRPFSTLTYLFNYAVLGNADHPAGYHVINFLLHAGNVLLVFWLVRRFNGRDWPAFFSAAVWAVHPVLTETVTNIVGRADLLAATGTLAGLACYLKFTDSRRVIWLAALAVVAAIGSFSKETGIIVILAILLHQFVFRPKWTSAQWLGLAAAGVPIACMLWQRHAVLSAAGPMEIPFTDNPIPWAGFWIARLTALDVIGREFGLILWPARLSADYSWAQIPLFSGAAAEWLLVAAAIALLPVTVALYRSSRTAFFFFALGLIWLAPVSNLLFATGAIMAERLLYLTALGVVVCIVFGAYALPVRDPRFAPAVLSLLILALAARTVARNPVWDNDLSIAEASVGASPKSFKTHDLLANVLFAADPSHANLDRVIAESEKSRAILAALPLNRRPPDPYLFASNLYMLQHEYAKAIPVLTTYSQLEPSNAEAFLRLSTAYLESGDHAKAAAAAGRARSLNPLEPRVYAQTAEIDASSGKLNEAAGSLIEGVFVTGDSILRQDLVELYQRAADPKSCVLTNGPNGPAINPACPAVHAQACAASEDVVKTLENAGKPDLAASRRQMFVEQFHCR